MAIQDRLIKIRESLGISQREMSTKVGGSIAKWQTYESGRSAPGSEVFEALSRLGFSVDWILTGEGNMRRESRGFTQTASGNGIIQAGGKISGTINQAGSARSAELEELVDLLEHYGTKSLKDDLKARLLRVKEALEGVTVGQLADGNGNIQAGRDVNIFQIIQSHTPPYDLEESIKITQAHLNKLNWRKGLIDGRILLAVISALAVMIAVTKLNVFSLYCVAIAAVCIYLGCIIQKKVSLIESEMVATNAVLVELCRQKVLQLLPDSSLVSNHPQDDC